MAAWVILIGFAVAVVGVIVKVGVDLARYLHEDRETHGGRQTVEAARRAWFVVAVVAVLVLILIVWPLILGDS
jgi:uncharacterized membrane protein